MRRYTTLAAIVATIGLASRGGVNGQVRDAGRDQFRDDDRPELSLTAEASPEKAITGSHVTYTLEVTNLGPGIASGVTVLDELPRETTFVSCSATGSGTCGGSGRSRRVRFDSLMPDVTETVTIVATVLCQTRDGVELENAASIRESAVRSGRDAEGAAGEAENESVFVTASNPPPVIVEPTLTPSLPWPEDEGTVDVTVGYLLRDNCGSDRVVLNVSRAEDVEASSAVKTPGTQRSSRSRDWEVVDAHHLRLRAERSAPANRRIFTVSITAIDSANQSSAPQVMTLTVPALK